eukprot:18242-Rhodomonas_salina.1
MGAAAHHASSPHCAPSTDTLPTSFALHLRSLRRDLTSSAGSPSLASDPSRACYGQAQQAVPSTRVCDSAPAFRRATVPGTPGFTDNLASCLVAIAGQCGRQGPRARTARTKLNPRHRPWAPRLAGACSPLFPVVSFPTMSMCGSHTRTKPRVAMPRAALSRSCAPIRRKRKNHGCDSDASKFAGPFELVDEQDSDVVFIRPPPTVQAPTKLWLVGTPQI